MIRRIIFCLRPRRHLWYCYCSSQKSDGFDLSQKITRMW